MRALYLIPARGGSKGVPRKNIKLLNGKPLIYYTIKAARQLSEDKDICVSTDDIEIKEVVESFGLIVPFLRPESLAEDNSPTEGVINHALEFYKQKGIEYNVVVLLQPTSPLRSGDHIKEALKIYNEDVDMVVSVFQTQSNPYYVLFEQDENGFLKKSKESNFTRRQDCPDVWELNGAIYIINVNTFYKKGMQYLDKKLHYEMDRKSSIDIDDEIDFKLVELIISHNL